MATRRGLIFSVWVACLGWGGIPAAAHFGMVIPDTMIMQAENRTVRLTRAFCHPFEGQGLELAQPKHFGVYAQGSRQELSAALAPIAGASLILILAGLFFIEWILPGGEGDRAAPAR